MTDQDQDSRNVQHGRRLCAQWCKAFIAEHGLELEKESLTAWQLAERAAEPDHLRAAAAGMDFTLFVTALVHYGSPDVSKFKLRQVERIVGEPMARRQYWIYLDRAHHYMAGAANSHEAAL